MATPAKQQVNDTIGASVDDDRPDHVMAHIPDDEPFVTVPGTFNARGMSPGHTSDHRPGAILRSGTLENVTPESVQALHNPGVKSIFDLRSLQERIDSPGPDVPGVHVAWHGS